MTEDQFQAMVVKIEREFPIRCQLAKMINIKITYNFDETMAELYLMISLRAPDKATEALALIRSVS